MGSVAVFSGTEGLSRGRDEFACWEEFEQKQDEYFGIWIAASWNQDIDELAARIRHSRSWYKLVFSESPCSSRLVDKACSPSEASSSVGRFEYLVKSSRVMPDSLSPAERLLFFMYLRDDYELEPVYQCDAKELYVYPAAASLAWNQDGPEWFLKLARSHMLTPSRLVDRIRKCRGCGSAHLSYVEVCPSCRSIQVARLPSMHCFACGHVDARPAFESAGGLHCPKCDVRLRHIGVDYDVTVEQFSCRECHTVCLETQVVGRCFDCGAKEDPQQLEVTEIYTYRINRASIEALRGRQLYGTTLPERAGFVMSDQFKFLVDWSSGTQRRYGVPDFSLLLLEFADIDVMVAHHGAQALMALLDEFGMRVREQLRATDVTSVDADDRIWILQPLSAPEVTQQRLLALADQVHPIDGPALGIRVRSFHSRRDMAPEDNSDSIMQKLLASEA